jgi:hypothetical protein
MTAIKIAAAPRFAVPVTLTRPGEESLAFEMTAKPLTRSEQGVWWSKLSDPQVVGEPARLAEWALEVFTDSKATFSDAAGAAVPFGPSLFDLLFETYPAAPHDLRICYTRALFESRAGN